MIKLFKFITPFMLLMLLLASCTTTTSTLPYKTTAPLCQHINSTNTLTVLRKNTISQNHFSFSFPAKTTIYNSKIVKSLAVSLCHLPPIPKGLLSCPVDFGIKYLLTFSTSNATFKTIKADIWGCQIVSGLTPKRWTINTNFWTNLAKAMQVHPPTENTLRGKLAV